MVIVVLVHHAGHIKHIVKELFHQRRLLPPSAIVNETSINAGRVTPSFVRLVQMDRLTPKDLETIQTQRVRALSLNLLMQVYSV